MREKLDIKLTGEVIEISEKNGSVYAKVKYNEGIIEIPLIQMEDIHLGEKVVIDSMLAPESLQRILFE